jgi:CRISPR-associated endonuclease/helicase Cas3
MTYQPCKAENACSNSYAEDHFNENVRFDRGPGTDGNGGFMETYYAHSGTKKDLSDGQKLLVHLQEVAERAKEFAQGARREDTALAAAAEAAGLLHDLGKYQEEWQQYLKDSVAKLEPASVPHSIHGAAYAGYTLGHQALCMAILGHHAGLADFDKASNDLEVRHSELVPLIEKLVSLAKSECPELPNTVADHPLDQDDKTSCRRYEFWTRVLFSILVDADRLETERFYTKRERPRRVLTSEGRGLTAENLLALLDAERGRRAEEKAGVLADLRNRVFDECKEAGRRLQPGFFELTVPTGGGKTFSGMAFALAHAERHKLRRVIVVIPYLSIIEQNAREYRQVFGSDVVIEHHSAVAENGPVPEGRAIRTPAELATENWDAPIIVTTSVQFLETLLSASPRRCRKLHNIARSVVLFDEAQAMPPHILNPLLSVFRELQSNYGVSFVFSTATQPGFRRSGGLTEGLRPDELCPILSSELTKQLFRELQRVNYSFELDTPWPWDTLTKRLLETPQALCVLNIRANAREVWQRLRKQILVRHDETAAEGVIHLSSAMCAQHRLDVLGPKDSYLPGSVRDRLLRKLPCWLISTQVIEAGVDVDFPCAFRALGPLDSIVQVAGRCNREGLLRDPATGESRRGDVYVFKPEEGGMPRGFYEEAAGEARTRLGEITGEQLATDPEVFTSYFTTLYSRKSTDAAPKGARSIQEMRVDFLFRSVAERAKVIDDGGTAVIVPYGEAEPIVKMIQRARFYDRHTLRRLQRFVVNLRPNSLRELEAAGLIAPLLPGGKEDGPQMLDRAAYDKHLGVVVGGRAPEEFII